MPPKKKPDAANKKTVEKAKQKVVEDKTFGLKNKKGKKQQQYIKNVANQVQGNQKKSAASSEPKLSKREIEQQKLAELNELFRPVQQAQKISAGADPKSVLCSFFKQGLCQKGGKCKFSHDLSLERKSEKRSLYTDERDEKESMENWDQATLEDVVNKKHGASNKAKPKTDIVCKHFLAAIEKNLYGWFWSCPNDDKCIYRHALPPGFVLKKDQKKEDEEEKISLEELIETERASLTGDLTPVTLESFLVWKKKKIQEKKAKLAKELTKKKEDFKSGMSKVSGREVFMFKPELADADDDEAGDDPNMYRREQEEDDSKVVEISLEALAASASQTDDSRVTKATTLSAKDRATANAPTSSTQGPTVNGTATTDVNGLDMACGGSAQNDPDDGKEPPGDTALVDGVPIDESLFEDLDDLDIGDDD